MGNSRSGVRAAPSAPWRSSAVSSSPSAAATSSCRAADGTTWTWDLVSNTVVRENGSKTSQSALATGEPVWVGGPVLSGVKDARLVVIRPPSGSSARPARHPRPPAARLPEAEHPRTGSPSALRRGTGLLPQAQPAGAGNLCLPAAPRPAPTVPVQVMTDNDRIPQVLVVDDEPNIRELVQVALKFHGCAVTPAASGQDALRQAEAVRPDLIVLDVMLPDLDGFEVCRRLRAGGQRRAGDLPDRAGHLVRHGDRAGPGRRRLRHQAVLGGGPGRPGPGGAAPGLAAPPRDGRRGRTTQAMLRVGDLELDESRWTVRRAGVPVDLSPTEFRLLAYLMRHQGRVLTRSSAAGERMGLGLRRAVPDRRDLRQLPAAQARPARPAADPHPARRRLQPAARRPAGG